MRAVANAVEDLQDFCFAQGCNLCPNGYSVSMPITEIVPGAVFNTEHERGCVATTHADREGNFLGIDSEGVECTYNTQMIALPYPRRVLPCGHFDTDRFEWCRGCERPC